MFRHVIVGVDGRQGGRDAIALARLLIAPQGGVMKLAYIDVLAPVAAAGGAGLDDFSGGDTELLERERAASDVQAELVTLIAASVGRGLHTVSESEQADLLVVGSSHRGVVGRVLIGDDTKASLNGAACAVAVAPTGYEHSMHGIKSVGVGYDDSPESRAALELARTVAGEHDARVRALNVVTLPAASFAGMAGSAWGDTAGALLSDAKRDMGQLQGVDGEAILGLPGEELAGFAERVDLLVVGSRGYGPLRRLVLGSTSTHLAGHARCPLLVLPRTADNQPA
jgi:nucleotide-binding universal stress UspA family protein